MLEKLDNNEAVLLMYLAEELPPEDRAEIERMLAGDGSLRRQFRRLRLAQETTERALCSLDAAATGVGRAPLEPGSPGEAAAIRRISRSMHMHLVRKLAERPAPAAKRGLRYPWWCYPTAATAASVLAFLVWYANSSTNTHLNIPAGGPDQQANLYPNEPTSPKVRALGQFWGPADDSATAAAGADCRGRAQLAALPSSSDDVAAVWNIDGTVNDAGSGAGQAHE